MSNKQNIRPLIPNIEIKTSMSREENFQNTTLRPILKLQHELLLAFFMNHTLRKKIDFTSLSKIKKDQFISNIFAKDSAFKNEIRGIIIGQFTEEEFNRYRAMTREVNKRLMSMLEERIRSGV